MRYVPAWVPGAGFKRKAQDWKKEVEDMVELPYKAAKEQIVSGASSLNSSVLIIFAPPIGQANGTAGPSYVSYHLDTINPSENNADFDRTIKETAGTIFSGKYPIANYAPKITNNTGVLSAGADSVGCGAYHRALVLTRTLDGLCILGFCSCHDMVSRCSGQSSEGNRSSTRGRSSARVL